MFLGASAIDVNVCAMGFVCNVQFKPSDAGRIMRHVGPL